MTVYPHDPRWDIKRPNKDPKLPATSMAEDIANSGNKSFNIDEFTDGEYGHLTMEALTPYFLSENPMDQSVLEYWEKRGLKKEMVLGGPQNWNVWTIFTPLSMYKDENMGRKYPLVIGLHGGNAGEFEGAPIFIAESTGYAKKAAEEEFILAMPEDHDAEPIMNLISYCKEHYAVDESKVYAMGFSAGGDRSVRVALRHPEVFAGICVGAGVPFNIIDDPAEIENAVNYKMPLICVGCLKDKGNHTPFYKWNPLDHPTSPFIEKLLSAEGKMKWVNRWFRINHIEGNSPEENEAYVKEFGTPSEKRIGMKAHRSREWDFAERHHYCLDYTDPDGIDIVRYVFIEGQPHFEPVNMMDMAWPYLSRFSRDQNGKLICSSKEFDR